MAGPGEVKPREPGYDHRRVDDRLQQPPFHHLERLGLLRSGFGFAMIDEQSRQIEHARHPCDDGDHMQRLDPLIHRKMPYSSSVVYRLLDRDVVAVISVAKIPVLSRTRDISASSPFLKQ